MPVVRRLHENLVRADTAHAVIDSFRRAPGLAFNVVQRTEMRQNANLPLTLSGQLKDGARVAFVAGAQRTWLGRQFRVARMSDHHPASRDGIFAQFHCFASYSFAAL